MTVVAARELEADHQGSPPQRTRDAPPAPTRWGKWQPGQQRVQASTSQSRHPALEEVSWMKDICTQIPRDLVLVNDAKLETTQMLGHWGKRSSRSAVILGHLSSGVIIKLGAPGVLPRLSRAVRASPTDLIRVI